MTDSLQVLSASFELDKEYSQVDLASYAELVVDFSDMVQSVYDTDSGLRSSQMA